MKLNPPASSSDIDAAREVAQRLNRVATPPEPARPLPPYAPVAGFRTTAEVKAPPPPLAPARTAPPLPSEPAPTPVHVPEPPPLPEPRFAAPPAPVAVAPAPPAAAAPVIEEEPVGVVDDPAPAHTAPPLPEQPPAPAPVVEEEPVGVAEEPAVEAPVSWPVVTKSVMALAEAKGSLLITSEGRVIAVAGDWPPPGADAIASRLVPAMDKALKDAPTRSVSVPLGGLHLTAWRVPTEASGLMTVGFVADAPLRPDLRPSIDAELKKGGDA